jgi:hypothetical protein
MIEIEITGLTKRQKVLADILWHIEDWNQVEVFMKSLPERDRIDCEGIIEMMRLSLVEQYAEAVNPKNQYEDAKEVIGKIRGLK